MNFDIYVINLDRSAERLDYLRQSAARHGLEFQRFPAVEGAKVPRADWKDVSALLFGLRTGRHILPGEYGCYRSHLDLLETIAQSPAPFAVILEDDVEMPDDFRERVTAIVAAVGAPAVVKLANHRQGGFLSLGKTALGDEIGVTMFGPQGSSAAYIVTREAAAKLSKRLRPMSLPYDTAFERGWQHHVPIYSVRQDVIIFVEQLRQASIILAGGGYRASKFKWFLRIPSYVFKGLENIARLAYAVWMRVFKTLRLDATVEKKTGAGAAH